MKTIITLLLSVIAFAAESATWTIHGCKDNYTELYFTDVHSTTVTLMVWDYQWDIANPSNSDSGLLIWDKTDPWAGIYSGYSDILQFDAPDSVFLWEYDISSSYPDYLGWFQFGYVLMPPEIPGGEWTYVDTGITAGEYWFDYDSSGTPRFLSAKPTDFGKWAWDGSINPSWVEPVAKKQHGKGRNK